MASVHSEEISLTDSAANKLKELKQKEDKVSWGLKFTDNKGFCKDGCEYIIGFTSCLQEKDTVFYSHGIAIYVPKESLQRLQGSIIEYTDVQALEHPEPFCKLGFTVYNPHVKGSRLCGYIENLNFSII